MIRVSKRDGSEEAFDCRKLTRAMWRAMGRTSGRFREARQLALAIRIHLERCGKLSVPSVAVHGMAVGVLRQAGLADAAWALETHSRLRELRRSRLRICHDGEKVTLWDKSWLSQVAQRSWFLSVRMGRLLAGEIESELLAAAPAIVSRRRVMALLNERVAGYGLADAVPLPQPATGA